MIKERFVKISESITDWDWYQDSNTSRLFIHCIIKANWKDGKFQGKEIKRGSFVTSTKKLSLELGLSEQNIKTAIKHLKHSGDITSKGQSKYSIITVLNYDKWQKSNKQSNSQNNNEANEHVTSNQPASNQQVTTIVEVLEEVERVEEVESNDTRASELTPTKVIENFTKNKNLITSLKQFRDMRKTIKKPITTERAMNDRLNELMKLSNDENIQIEIVNQSVDNCWQRFYELKNAAMISDKKKSDTNNQDKMSDAERQKLLDEVNEMKEKLKKGD